ncbi:MAG: S4 domain-containing protein, partial [Thermomicrobiales bacterium]
MSGPEQARPVGKHPVRERLDEALVARGLAETRSQARALIMAGSVRSGDRVLDKPGMPAPAGPLDVAGGGRVGSGGGGQFARPRGFFSIGPARPGGAAPGAPPGGV